MERIPVQHSPLSRARLRDPLLWRENPKPQPLSEDRFADFVPLVRAINTAMAAHPLDQKEAMFAYRLLVDPEGEKLEVEKIIGKPAYMLPTLMMRALSIPEAERIWEDIDTALNAPTKTSEQIMQDILSSEVLTERQKEIALRLLNKESYGRIAEDLNLKKSTVATTAKTIEEKGFHVRTAA